MSRRGNNLEDEPEVKQEKHTKEKHTKEASKVTRQDLINFVTLYNLSGFRRPETMKTATLANIANRYMYTQNIPGKTEKQLSKMNKDKLRKLFNTLPKDIRKEIIQRTVKTVKNAGKRLKQIDKHLKQNAIQNIRQLVINFQNGPEKRLELSINNSDEFNAMKEAIRVKPGWHTVIMLYGDWRTQSGYTINAKTIVHLAEWDFNVLEKDFYTESDKDLIKSVRQNRKVVIEQEDISPEAKEARKRVHKKKEKQDKEKARKSKQKLEERGGKFFPYTNPYKLDLTRYQIFSHIDPKFYTENCLIYALRQSNRFDTMALSNLTDYVKDGSVPQKNLSKIAERLNIKFEVYSDTETKHKRTYGTSKTTMQIGLIKQHWFLVEPTKYNRYAVEHYAELNDKYEWWRFKSANRKEDRGLNSFDLITLMLKNNMFEPITMNSENIFKTRYVHKLDENLTTLEYPESAVKDQEPDIKDPKNYNYWMSIFTDENEPIRFDYATQDEEDTTKQPEVYYADFEAATDAKYHTPYQCCVVHSAPDDELNTEVTFNGEDCAKELLNYLAADSITIFHNLGYDWQFIAKHCNVTNIINTGSMIKKAKVRYYGKELTFIDSYAMIAEKISKFDKMFKLKVKKGILPYKAYNANTVNAPYIPISEAVKHIDKDERQEFLKAAQPYIQDGNFYHIKYSEFYCMQDCRVLQQGYTKFREWIKAAFDCDPINFLSLPSLAHHYLTMQGCYRGVVQLSGVPRVFINKCMKGGRVMCRDNKKWHVEDELADFDAVSLYPSAMYRMPGFLKGKPKILPNNTTIQDLLNLNVNGTPLDGYFIEVKNVQVAKKCYFPLQSELTEDGTRDYINNFSKNLFLDRFQLEDFVKYQGATMEFVRGYYFNEGRNNRINNVIKYCFEQRKKHKQAGNPIQVVYKLLMNAAYGKTLQKPIKYNIKFTNSVTQHKKFLTYHYEQLHSFHQFGEGKVLHKLYKNVEQHFNYVHVGVEILSFSKRIMNEVITLAEDLKIMIYYQDTDSMHITARDIPKLSKEFKKLYDRDLIGEDLGQFHSDFTDDSPKINIKKYNKNAQILSIESYFLGKKMYYDLFNTGGEHIRLKGASVKSIEDQKSTIGLYKRLYEGETVELNMLANGAIAMLRRPDYTISNREDFTRKVRTRYRVGDPHAPPS